MQLSVIFDCTSWCTSSFGEAPEIVLKIVGRDWRVERHLVRVQMLFKSLTGELVQKSLISVHSPMTITQPSHLLHHIMPEITVEINTPLQR